MDVFLGFLLLIGLVVGGVAFAIGLGILVHKILN